MSPVTRALPVGRAWLGRLSSADDAATSAQTATTTTWQRGLSLPPRLPTTRERRCSRRCLSRFFVGSVNSPRRPHPDVRKADEALVVAGRTCADRHNTAQGLVLAFALRQTSARRRGGERVRTSVRVGVGRSVGGAGSGSVTRSASAGQASSRCRTARPRIAAVRVDTRRRACDLPPTGSHGLRRSLAAAAVARTLDAEHAAASPAPARTASADRPADVLCSRASTAGTGRACQSSPRQDKRTDRHCPAMAPPPQPMQESGTFASRQRQYRTSRRSTAAHVRAAADARDRCTGARRTRGAGRQNATLVRTTRRPAREIDGGSTIRPMHHDVGASDCGAAGLSERRQEEARQAAPRRRRSVASRTCAGSSPCPSHASAS